ncbi:MAG: hypothetical protein ACRD96_28105 [Bryobacteraceae bacterium]
MFDSLADRMKEDDRAAVKTSERAVRWAAVVVISCALFGALYFGVRMLE